MFSQHPTKGQRVATALFLAVSGALLALGIYLTPSAPPQPDACATAAADRELATILDSMTQSSAPADSAVRRHSAIQSSPKHTSRKKRSTRKKPSSGKTPAHPAPPRDPFTPVAPITTP